MKDIYENTNNINDVYELSTIISQTPNFDIVISDNTEDIQQLISSYGYDILYSGSNEMIAYGKYAIQLMNQYGESAISAIAIQGKEIIDAQANGDIDTVKEKIIDPFGIEINYNDYISHLTTYSQRQVINKLNGVYGNHKLDFFNQYEPYIKSLGKYEIVDRNDVKHNTIDGIITINYHIMETKTTGRQVYYGSSKSKPQGLDYKKTVYTLPITDNDIIELSKEAMQNAIDNNRFDIEKDTYIWGETKNGLKFEGYRDNSTNEITTFYPVEN